MPNANIGNEPRGFPVTSRLNIRSLATCARHLVAKGFIILPEAGYEHEQTLSISKLIATIVESATQVLIDHYGQARFGDSEEALEYLINIGLLSKRSVAYKEVLRRESIDLTSDAEADRCYKSLFNTDGAYIPKAVNAGSIDLVALRIRRKELRQAEAAERKATGNLTPHAKAARERLLKIHERRRREKE